MNFFLNLSLISLQCKSHLMSPYFILSNAKTNLQFFLKESTFSRFLSPVLFSKTDHYTFNIYKCNFNYFLNSLVIFQKSTIIKDMLFESPLTMNSEEAIQINHCLFQNIIMNHVDNSSELHEKAVIQTDFQLIILNSHFYNVTGDQHGCIYSTSFININESIFEKCHGQKGACLFLAALDNHQTSTMFRNQFKLNSAYESSSFKLEASGTFYYEECNTTYGSSIHPPGAFDVATQYIFIKMSIFEHCFANLFVGGLLLRNFVQLSLEYCFFYNITQHSNENRYFYPSAVFVFSGEVDSRVTRSIFLDCTKKYIVGSQHTAKLCISECVFNSNKGEAIHLSDNIIVFSCIFNKKIQKIDGMYAISKDDTNLYTNLIQISTIYLSIFLSIYLSYLLFKFKKYFLNRNQMNKQYELLNQADASLY